MMEALDANLPQAQVDDETANSENIFSGRNLLDLNKYINSEKFLHSVKFHSNSDVELINLISTVGWWLRSHVNDEDTCVSWELSLSSSPNLKDAEVVKHEESDGLHLCNGWKILSNGLMHEEPLIRLTSIYAILEGGQTIELEEEYSTGLLKVVVLVAHRLMQMMISDDFDQCRLLAMRALSHTCQSLFKHISEYSTGKIDDVASNEEITSDSETDGEDEESEDIFDLSKKSLHPIEVLLLDSFSAILKQLSRKFNVELSTLKTVKL